MTKSTRQIDEWKKKRRRDRQTVAEHWQLLKPRTQFWTIPRAINGCVPLTWSVTWHELLCYTKIFIDSACIICIMSLFCYGFVCFLVPVGFSWWIKDSKLENCVDVNFLKSVKIVMSNLIWRRFPCDVIVCPLSEISNAYMWVRLYVLCAFVCA